MSKEKYSAPPPPAHLTYTSRSQLRRDTRRRLLLGTPPVLGVGALVLAVVSVPGILEYQAQKAVSNATSCSSTEGKINFVFKHASEEVVGTYDAGKNIVSAKTTMGREGIKDVKGKLKEKKFPASLFERYELNVIEGSDTHALDIASALNACMDRLHYYPTKLTAFNAAMHAPGNG